MHKMFELASAESCWRGVDYYRKRKVISFEKVADVKQGGYYNPGEECIYKGLVRGRSPSEDDGYNGSPGRPVLSPEEAKQYNKSDAPIYYVRSDVFDKQQNQILEALKLEALKISLKEIDEDGRRISCP